MDNRINKNRTMKLLSINHIKWQMAFVFLFINQLVQADDFPDFLDDAEDVPAAPIDDWIFPMVLLGIVMIVYYSKKKQPTKV